MVREYIPLDRELIINQGDVIYDYSRPFEDQKPNIFHLNASITYRINKKKHSSIWSIQVLNLLGAEENYGYAYNYRTDQLEEYKASGDCTQPELQNRVLIVLPPFR